MTNTKSRRKKIIVAASYNVATVKELFKLTDEEYQTVELMLALAKTIRAVRKRNQLTRRQLAKQLDKKRSQIIKIETLPNDVTLDNVLHVLFAAGGNLSDLIDAATAAWDCCGPRANETSNGTILRNWGQWH